MSVKRSRIRKSKNDLCGYFRPEDYFLMDDEVCADCPSRKHRPAYKHHHCLRCHRDIKSPPRLKDLRSTLRGHYKKYGMKEAKSGAFIHDLADPPRKVEHLTFGTLNEEDKTLVREGILFFSY